MLAFEYVQLYLLSMPRPSLKEKIIAAGVNTLHERGFAAAGIREITTDAGVPQGCFTNHFRSKEAFAVTILDRYHENTQAIMDRTLRDESRAPAQRLRAYFDEITTWLEAAGWRYGCLVGNMSLEMPEHSEILREHLVDVCRSLTQSFASTVRAAQAAGEVRNDLDADDVATFVLASWEGAMMRMKVDRSPKPIEQFKRVLFATIIMNCDPQ
ncbi:TetR/AcrR family transcriptional repressor of nem operon [Rhizobium sp. BK619]|uniref:TetR/AcrR family transcriptional regulator n=1 Tax=Rhizobium sp. BK619 TaxID=2586989 RepID=UPI0017D452CE|nr:TetR/AcrR family transcriptional regulator [Rhizobium sp. BK619]MBB3644520.1 TetR/AcrR family transcriptional repressor of nem operon [Rhizobium sp. BK619]